MGEGSSWIYKIEVHVLVFSHTLKSLRVYALKLWTHFKKILDGPFELNTNFASEGILICTTTQKALDISFYSKAGYFIEIQSSVARDIRFLWLSPRTCDTCTCCQAVITWFNDFGLSNTQPFDCEASKLWNHSVSYNLVICKFLMIRWPIIGFYIHIS